MSQADFLVFDKERGLPLLGSNPTYDYMFAVSNAVHEAPVYWEAGNRLFMSQLAPPPGFLPQLEINLDNDPPTLSEYLSDPPVYAPNGATFHNGMIVWGKHSTHFRRWDHKQNADNNPAASGGNDSIGGGEQRSGVRLLDPATNKSTTILNNYFGFYFNTVDDICVDKYGDIWFTDPMYSWFNLLTDTPPQLESASYRFRPSTGSVTMIDEQAEQPNGIAWSPDFKSFYISDSGAVTATYSPFYTDPSVRATGFNATGRRTIYKYDVYDSGTQLSIGNRRPIYLSQDWIPDGLKVALNGMVVTGTGRGVDVLDDEGNLILRVQTNYTVQNFCWVKDRTTGRWTELWMGGNGGISRVRWELEGQHLV